MKKLLLITAALTLFATGCRTASLGPDTGIAYRKAFAAQAASKSNGSALSANDAKNVTHSHYRGAGAKGAKSKGAPRGGLYLSPSPMGASSTTSSVPAGEGGGIQLRAK